MFRITFFAEEFLTVSHKIGRAFKFIELHLFIREAKFCFKVKFQQATQVLIFCLERKFNYSQLHVFDETFVKGL